MVVVLLEVLLEVVLLVVFPLPIDHFHLNRKRPETISAKRIELLTQEEPAPLKAPWQFAGLQ